MDGEEEDREERGEKAPTTEKEDNDNAIGIRTISERRGAMVSTIINNTIVASIFAIFVFSCQMGKR